MTIDCPPATRPPAPSSRLEAGLIPVESPLRPRPPTPVSHLEARVLPPNRGLEPERLAPISAPRARLISFAPSSRPLPRAFVGLVLAVFLAALLPGCPVEPPIADDDDVADDDDTPSDPVWDAFLGERDGHLRALSEPILDCVDQPDTTHPAFHGCIDWHSAVHGTFSLLAISRMTGDPSFAAAADDVLEAQAVADELAVLEAGGPFPNERPYGYAWFLALARERERAGGDDLIPLSDVVTSDLSAYITAMSADTFAEDLHDDDYQNLSWALLNLWTQAAWQDDVDQAEWIEGVVRDSVLPIADQCPLTEAIDNVFDFFPPCLHQARLIVEVLPADEAADWLLEALPDPWDLPPLTDAPSPHIAGLNFSRTWGLYALWEATGDPELRDLYIAHVDAMMSRPELWAEEYYSYSHWVAQFGVYGLALTDGVVP